MTITGQFLVTTEKTMKIDSVSSLEGQQHQLELELEPPLQRNPGMDAYDKKVAYEAKYNAESGQYARVSE